MLLLFIIDVITKYILTIITIIFSATAFMRFSTLQLFKCKQRLLIRMKQQFMHYSSA